MINAPAAAQPYGTPGAICAHPPLGASAKVEAVSSLNKLKRYAPRTMRGAWCALLLERKGLPNISISDQEIAIAIERPCAGFDNYF